MKKIRFASTDNVLGLDTSVTWMRAMDKAIDLLEDGTSENKYCYIATEDKGFFSFDDESDKFFDFDIVLYKNNGVWNYEIIARHTESSLAQVFEIVGFGDEKVFIDFAYQEFNNLCASQECRYYWKDYVDTLVTDIKHLEGDYNLEVIVEDYGREYDNSPIREFKNEPICLDMFEDVEIPF